MTIIQARIDKIVFALIASKATQKECRACGLTYLRVPEIARVSTDPDMGGWYWECVCKSTLYVPAIVPLEEAA